MVPILEAMKCFLLISVAITACAAIKLTEIKELTERYQAGHRYFYFPGDGDGVVHLVDTKETVNEAFLQEYEKNPAYNSYWLFTRSNPETEQVLVNGDASSVRKSNFKASKDTVFLAHGWKGSGTNAMNQKLTEAFLENKDVNVIVLDWSQLANQNYLTAKSGTAEAGRELGQFVEWLVTLGVSYERVHLVGFSLGAHLVGNAGRETGSLVRRITALDPAGPLWDLDSERLSRDDGQYVEAIHTNTAFFGIPEACGDADFYPNGGSSQPGCKLNSCSHSRAYEYMASTVEFNNLLANKCATYEEAIANNCHGEVDPMGNSDLNKSLSGIFRVNTESKYPY